MLQSEVDFDNPEERFLWVLMHGLSYNGFPFSAPPPVFREWSRLLSDCGFVHVSQLSSEVDRERFAQRLHYQPPLRGSDGVMMSAGEFVPVDQEIQQPVSDMISGMTLDEKMMFLREFQKSGLISSSDIIQEGEV